MFPKRPGPWSITLVAGLCTWLAPGVRAAAVIEVGSPMGTISFDSDTMGSVTPIGPNSFIWMGVMDRPDLGWHLEWNLTIDTDPKITGVSAFTNTMPMTSNFTFNIFAFSSVAIASPTVNGASTISVLDTDNDGATMAALPGGSIYDAFIVASSQQTLFNDPFALVAPPQGVNQTGAIWGPQAATVPLAVGDVFGINHAFSLTGLDQATINSSFFIVPEPATVTLALLAFGVLMTRRR